MQCICVLCGLPGSGKSSFCASLPDRISNTKFDVIKHVEFDALEIEIQVHQDKDDEDLNRWHEARAMAFVQVEQLLTTEPGKRKLVLVDDNMYYQSMRKPYLQLARKYGTGYVQVMFEASVQQAKELNAARTGKARVEDRVIERMGSLMEPLNARYTVTFSSPLDGMRVLTYHCEKSQRPRGDEDTFWFVVEQACADPEIDSKEMSRRDRQLTLENRAHQLELALRQAVGVHIQSQPVDKRKQAAKDAAMKKKQFVESHRLTEGEDITALVQKFVNLL